MGREICKRVCMVAQDSLAHDARACVAIPGLNPWSGFSTKYCTSEICQGAVTSILVQVCCTCDNIIVQQYEKPSWLMMTYHEYLVTGSFYRLTG